MGGNVLVTGGAGYIGSVTARAFARSGRRVVVLDDFSTGHADNVRWGPLVTGDIADKDLVRGLVRDAQITAVVHFAAKALVGESVRDPALYDHWNREKTEALVEVCAEGGVSAFVFSSTCAVYGTPDQVPIPVAHDRAPVNPYGVSKARCEDAIAGSGMPHALLRYFNAAGAVPAARLGERHDPETHLIPLTLRARVTGNPLTIFGTDYPTPDGTCIRDYIHVLDLADAHLRALAHLEAGQPSGAWNLGTGGGASVREVIQAVERVTEGKVPVQEGVRREGDPAALVADARSAERDLGWHPAHSELDRIVADAWAYERGDVA
ncbi:MAG: UDP-glucose 4-epimerase GalE [Planctomycetota bacterium]|nr:UDP-glucose 4-epimerase GalE [Planctomycetota bacterium]